MNVMAKMSTAVISTGPVPTASAARGWAKAIRAIVDDEIAEHGSSKREFQRFLRLALLSQRIAVERSDDRLRLARHIDQDGGERAAGVAALAHTDEK